MTAGNSVTAVIFVATSAITGDPICSCCRSRCSYSWLTGVTRFCGCRSSGCDCCTPHKHNAIGRGRSRVDRRSRWGSEREWCSWSHSGGAIIWLQIIARIAPNVSLLTPISTTALTDDTSLSFLPGWRILVTIGYSFPAADDIMVSSGRIMENELIDEKVF